MRGVLYVSPEGLEGNFLEKINTGKGLEGMSVPLIWTPFVHQDAHR